MANVAKIGLLINHCSDCPYAVHRSEYAGWHCIHDMQRVGLSVGDGQDIPDFCPFVLSALQSVLDGLTDSGCHLVDPAYGQSFLEDCISLGVNSPDYVQKEVLLLKIAATLQDNCCPAIQLAYLNDLRNNSTLSSEDAKVIESALSRLTDLSLKKLPPDKSTLVSAALMLDLALRSAVQHSVVSVKFLLCHRANPASAELHYVTSGNFDLAGLIKGTPELVTVPQHIACTFLKLPQFRFLVNGTEVELTPLLPG